jgi:hypothetical protein
MIISVHGKGGSGKTTVAAWLRWVFENSTLYVDADVNQGLFKKHQLFEWFIFHNQWEASVGGPYASNDAVVRRVFGDPNHPREPIRTIMRAADNFGFISSVEALKEHLELFPHTVLSETGTFAESYLIRTGNVGSNEQHACHHRVYGFVEPLLARVIGDGINVIVDNLAGADSLTACTPPFLGLSVVVISASRALQESVEVLRQYKSIATGPAFDSLEYVEPLVILNGCKSQENWNLIVRSLVDHNLISSSEQVLPFSKTPSLECFYDVVEGGSGYGVYQLVLDALSSVPTERRAEALYRYEQDLPKEKFILLRESIENGSPLNLAEVLLKQPSPEKETLPEVLRSAGGWLSDAYKRQYPCVEIEAERRYQVLKIYGELYKAAPLPISRDDFVRQAIVDCHARETQRPLVVEPEWGPGLGSSPGGARDIRPSP